MKNSLKIFCMATFVFSTFTINAKISGDLWQGASELRKVPNQLSQIVPSIRGMYQKLRETKSEIQSKIQEANNAKGEIDSIKELLETNAQMQLLPQAKRDTLKAALDALTKNDKSGALDILSNVLTALETRMNTVVTNSPKQILQLSTQIGLAIGKINDKKLGKTLPERMESVSNIIDTFGF